MTAIQPDEDHGDMSGHPDESLVVLTSVLHAEEAAAIVAALEAESIRARAVGGHLADFRLPVSSAMSIYVLEPDRERAMSVLEQYRAQPPVDWSKIDVGDIPEDDETQTPE